MTDEERDLEEYLKTLDGKTLNEEISRASHGDEPEGEYTETGLWVYEHLLHERQERSSTHE
jgi:hypothetical protein